MLLNVDTLPKTMDEKIRKKIEKFKELIKQGYSVRKARSESKLHPSEYTKYYDDIWSDPELAPFRDRTKKQVESSKPPSPVLESVERLKEYGLDDEEKTEFEREFEELERKRRAMLKAAQRAIAKYGNPLDPSLPDFEYEEREGKGKEGRDPLEEFEAALESFEEKRAKVKKVLERMGFKVEDVYMTREEVEKLIEETKRKTIEEALEDKRIEAVENIIREAITQIVQMFSPAVDAWMKYSLEGRSREDGGGQVSKSSKPQENLEHPS